MKLIILAAGRGTRFGGVTNTKPKGLVPVLGRPLLEHVLLPYLPYVSDIIFVINDGLGAQIKKHFKQSYKGHKVFYKIQAEQKGTMDALFTCRDLVKEGELFCVGNGDDLLKEIDIKNAIEKGKIGIGISKKIMPKSYLGIKTEGKNVLGFGRHDARDERVEDVFYNGFNILDKKVFDFHPIMTRDGELGLPHTLFANLDAYPLEAFEFGSWETVNRPEDIPKAEKFLKN